MEQLAAKFQIGDEVLTQLFPAFVYRIVSIEFIRDTWAYVAVVRPRGSVEIIDIVTFAIARQDQFELYSFETGVEITQGE